VEFILALLLLGGTADRVVAIVDKDPILSSDVELMLNLAQLEGQVPDSLKDSLRGVLLDRLIAQKLVFKKAAQDTNIQIDRDALAENVDAQLNNFFSQLDTMPQEAAEIKKMGLTRERLRGVLLNQSRFEATVQQMLMLEGKTQPYVSPNEIKGYYDLHKDSLAKVPGYIDLAYIAMGIGPSEAEQARITRKIAEVYDILARGGEFDVVAESFSEDQKTSKNGGLLGWVKRGELYPEIDSVLFSLPVGKVSAAQSREGYHLFLVENRSGNKVYARQILFALHITRSDTMRVMKRADEIRSEIISGKLTFEQAAELYSEDSTTREKGGFIGRIPLAVLQPPFDSVIATIDSGQISKPFVSDIGVYLVYARDKKNERSLSFEEVQTPIRNYLTSTKQEEWVADIVAEAKKEFYVEKRP
jgi:peptidyl-prolyl cis-trans isomerase SurA